MFPGLDRGGESWSRGLSHTAGIQEGLSNKLPSPCALSPTLWCLCPHGVHIPMTSPLPPSLCCPHPHGIHIPGVSSSLWCLQPCGIPTLTVSPSMWHLHTPSPFAGAGVSPGLWVTPVHPTGQRGCVSWAQAAAQGAAASDGTGWAREGESRRLFLGSTSHTGTGSHGKGWAQEPCTHQSTQGCSGGGFFLCPSGQGAIKHQEVPFPHQFRANFLSRNQGVRLPWAARPPLRHQTHSHSPCHRNPFTKSNVRASPLQPAEPPSHTPARLLRLWQPLPNNLHNAKHTWPLQLGQSPQTLHRPHHRQHPPLPWPCQQPGLLSTMAGAG